MTILKTLIDVVGEYAQKYPDRVKILGPPSVKKSLPSPEPRYRKFNIEMARATLHVLMDCRYRAQAASEKMGISRCAMDSRCNIYTELGFLEKVSPGTWKKGPNPWP